MKRKRTIITIIIINHHPAILVISFTCFTTVISVTVSPHYIYIERIKHELLSLIRIYLVKTETYQSSSNVTMKIRNVFWIRLETVFFPPMVASSTYLDDGCFIEYVRLICIKSWAQFCLFHYYYFYYYIYI